MCDFGGWKLSSLDNLIQPPDRAFYSEIAPRWGCHLILMKDILGQELQLESEEMEPNQSECSGKTVVCVAKLPSCPVGDEESELLQETQATLQTSQSLERCEHKHNQ